MIVDAGVVDRTLFSRVFDVCVVGAGPAGITLAESLAAQNLDVALMEAGDLEFTSESQELYEGDIVGMDYFDLDVPRLRFFGGTSNHWDGRSRSLDPHDFRPHPWHALSGWPVTAAELDPWRAKTDEILDLPPRDVFPDEIVEGAEDDLRSIRFRRSPPTRFNTKYRDGMAASGRITLVVNANLVDLRLNEALTTVETAVFRSYDPDDTGFTVRARAFCLCMGGLENPRFLLNARSQMPAGIGNAHDQVGRYFSEHPTYRIGEVLFENGAPKSRGYAPTPEMMDRLEVLNSNILLLSEGLDPGTEALRSLACSADFMEELARKVLGRGFDCGVGGLSAYFEVRRSEAWHHGGLGIIIEQALNPDSRVLLSDRRDRFGHQRIALDWRLAPLDIHTMRETAVVMGQYLASEGIGRLQVADWLLAEPARVPGLWDEGHEVALSHHMCTTRMSDSPKEGVVDRNCRVHGMENLYIGGSSVFATGGHANPTWTIVILALRLGDHLGRNLSEHALKVDDPAERLEPA